MVTKRWIIAIMMIAALAAGCAGTPTADEPDAPATDSPLATPPVPSGTSAPGAPGLILEGPRWILAAFGEDSTFPLFSANRIDIVFDPAADSLGGFAGCNRYFAGYTLDGSALILDPIGSTMMACLGEEMDLETEYLQRMGRVAGYTLSGDVLTLHDAQGAVLLTFRADPFSGSAAFTRTELENAAYPIADVAGGSVQLQGGVYTQAFEEDPASQFVLRLSNHIAFGDLDADGQEDAVVILITSAGGTGVFYNLIVVRHAGSELVMTQPILLGDRVQIRSLAVVDGRVAVDLVRSGPEDPLCCPTQHVIQRFVLVNDALIELGTQLLDQ